MTQIENKIIRVTDASPDIIAIIRAMDGVMTAPAMDQTSRYGTQTSRYMVILKDGADVRAIKEAIKELNATIVRSEFG